MPDDSRPMFNAVCATCGKRCEVPFRPSGDRPVYCKECFRAKQEGAPGAPSRAKGSPAFSSSPQPRPSGGQGASLAAELRAINAKLDRVLRAVEGASPASAPAAAKTAGKKPAAKKKTAKKK